jgi:hypothetical protein
VGAGLVGEVVVNCEMSDLMVVEVWWMNGGRMMGREKNVTKGKR